MIHWTWYIPAAIMLLYSARILSYLSGWRRMVRNPGRSKERKGYPGCKVSVIVPFRNEKENLQGLMKDLAGQDVTGGETEVILVDDHSSDGSAERVKKFIRSHGGFRLLNLDDGQTGKKAAIRKGIRGARGSIIITTDADCRVSQGWIRGMTGTFNTPGVRMVLGPVILEPGNGIFSRFQSLEFFSLLGTAAGAASINSPVLSNAANLAFRREDCLEHLDRKEDRTPSGDDMFLMMWVREHYPGSICFTASQDAVVYTAPRGSPGGFFNQRIRWSSKVRFFTHPDVLLTALLVYLSSFSLLAILLSGVFHPGNLALFGLLFLVKSLTDLAFLVPVLGYYGYARLLWLFMPLELFYFLYVSLTGLMGFILPYTWKGRKVRPAGIIVNG